MTEGYRSAQFLVLLAALGCSGPADDAPGAAGSGGRAPSGGAGAGSSNGGSSNGGGSNGGGAGGPNGAVLTVRDLASLALDNRWTYTVTGSGFSCPTGSQSTTVESFATFAGREAYQVRDVCSPDELTAYSFEGDSLLQNYGPMEWHTVMASPLEDGASWFFLQEVTITWHAVASITVPAGTFTNCFMRTVSQSPDLQATFCPGVGQVRRVDDDFTAVLESYELH